MMFHDKIELIRSLCALGRETEWIEFKENRFDREEVGKYISALANSAMLHDEKLAYLVFGVSDRTCNIVGTKLTLKNQKKGNEPFESWVNRMLSPRITLQFDSVVIDGKRIEFICIEPGYVSPVRFQQVSYLRIDSTTKPLRDYPERERSLWALTSRHSFENTICSFHMREDDLFSNFDVQILFERLEIPAVSRSARIEKLIALKMLNDDKQRGYDITNLLAIIAANDLQKFQNLSDKGVRVVTYKDSSKLTATDDVTGARGYGLRFTVLLRYIMDRIPHEEDMIKGQRVVNYSIPEVAVREILANAMIHQDFMVPGSGPLVEIFENRIVITNPGKPLVETSRFIDSPSKTRNNELAKIMRQMRFCEQRGSGVDRALQAIEARALPAPLFQVVADSTVVTLYGPRHFSDMSKEDRVRACYQHAAVCHEQNEPMSNASLRARLNLSDKQYPQASRVISDALDAGLIKPLNGNQPNRNAKYVPNWA